MSYAWSEAMSTVFPEHGRLLEGIGDEVVLALGGVVGVALLFWLAVRMATRDAGRRGIHPRQTGPVEDTRRARGVREEAPAVEAGPAEEAGPGGPEQSCPICLGGVVGAVDTNCGHRFCAACALTYWQHDQWPRPARCAVCRRPVSPAP